MNRHIGLAWLDLPLSVPETDMSIKVANLRCEYLENPLGIDQIKPRLSWKLESEQRGQRQTAYRVLVASSREKLEENTGDLWDSGKVQSGQSIHVAYDGKALVSRLQCFWKVMVWDKDGMASEWSDTARWSMGLLHPEDWKAQWIGVATPLKPRDVTVTKASYQTLDASVVVDVTAIVKQELAKNKPLTVDFKTLGGDPARGVVKELVVEYTHQGKPGIARAKDFETLKWTEAPTSPFYRQSFHIDDLPERAMIYVAPLGYFELYVNGHKVGDEVLAPAVSNFSKRSYYRTYEVTRYLRKGSNSLGIWMGTGWYSPGLPGVKNDSPVVRAQLELSDAGKEQYIVTNTAWQTKPSERKLLSEWRWGKFGGERVDARLWDRQWWDTQRSPQGWRPIMEVDVADVPCTSQTCGGNVRLAPLTPCSVERLDKDTILVDFGTNLTGLMNMTFRNLEPGQIITLYYGDLDGRPNDEAWRAKQTKKGFAVYGQYDEFVSAGAAQETFNNVFNYHAFRYVLIEGLPYVPEKTDMTAVPVETEVREVGSFSCSNDLYNRIHEMVRWTYRCLNLGGQTVDCPHRERLGYGDGQTIMDTGCFNFDAASLYAKWSQNWWDEQTESGFVPFTAPCPHKTGGGPAWGAMCVMVPWKTYLFYQDTALLEQGYPYMKKYLAYLEAHCKDGILQDIFPGERWPNLGDWVPPRRGMDKQDWVDDRSRRFFNNCYRVYLLQTVQTIAGILGKADDVRAFERKIRTAQEKIHNTWFNPADNTYANGEQPYLIFPLKTGVTPEPLRGTVFGQYCKTLFEKDAGHLNTGMIGTQIMVDYLLEMDRNDLVDTMVNKTTYPGWGYMIEKGATTCWEQWNGYYSQIHSCFPYIGGWFYRGLAGIRWDPEAPGFKHVILRPGLVKSVDWVKCSYDSPYGKIVSNWKCEDRLFRWDISIPVNSTATVFVPAKDTKSIREGATSLQKAPGVTFLRMEGRSAVLRVESGHYEFVSEYAGI
jgi:alpha-L-rhamnosidase